MENGWGLQDQVKRYTPSYSHPSIESGRSIIDRAEIVQMRKKASAGTPCPTRLATGREMFCQRNRNSWPFSKVDSSISDSRWQDCRSGWQRHFRFELESAVIQEQPVKVEMGNRDKNRTLKCKTLEDSCFGVAHRTFAVADGESWLSGRTVA
jgi:hypothetical protein